MHSLAPTLNPLLEATKTGRRKKRVLVIAGPTASGKTELSIALSQVVGGEVISADSMQVYRGMDIGTAKPTPEQRLLIAHHMIDVCDLHESFNVAEFYGRTQESLRSIVLRDNVPIVVGGSGFYIHTLLYGAPAGPPSDPDVRKQLEKQMHDMGPEALYQRLQQLDPEYASTLSTRDRHKIIRALEIIALSELPVSHFQKAKEPEESLYDYRCWFLYYPRERLYARIDSRCDEMIRKGFLDEVKELETKGLRGNGSASQAIGYRQALAFLDSDQTDDNYITFVTHFKRATRQFAKRQFTWFRKEPLFRWLNIEEHSPDRLKELILQDFEQGL
ncbi:MAG: tRNA dimethylallyltransferase [Chlamydiota bacterium]|jgi:tRNA dimethylallyltransferase